MKVTAKPLDPREACERLMRGVTQAAAIKVQQIIECTAEEARRSTLLEVAELVLDNQIGHRDGLEVDALLSDIASQIRHLARPL